MNIKYYKMKYLYTNIYFLSGFFYLYTIQKLDTELDT